MLGQKALDPGQLRPDKRTRAVFLVDRKRQRRTPRGERIAFPLRRVQLVAEGLDLSLDRRHQRLGDLVGGVERTVALLGGRGRRFEGYEVCARTIPALFGLFESVLLAQQLAASGREGGARHIDS